MAVGLTLVFLGCSRPPTTPRENEPKHQTDKGEAPAQPSERSVADTGPSASEGGDAIEQPPDEDTNAGCRFRRNTMRVTACEKSNRSFGGWSPSPADVARVFRDGGAANACYCANGLIQPIEACMQKLGTSLVSVTLGALDEATDCTIHVAAAELGQRRWVRVEALNRDRATFYSVDVVVAVLGTSLAPYYEGFNGIPKGGRGDGGEGVSAEMLRDWPTLPAELRSFLGERP